MVRRARGSALSLVGAFLVIYGLVQILFLVLTLSIVGLAWILFPLTWIPLVIGAVYVVLGFGLHDRHMWAYTGTLIFMTLMFLFNVWMLIMVRDLLISSAFHAVIDILVLVYVGSQRSEFEWKSTGRVFRKRPLEKEEMMKLACKKCGSENLDVYPDGSGICTECRHVFSGIQKKS